MIFLGGYWILYSIIGNHYKLQGDFHTQAFLNICQNSSNAELPPDRNFCMTKTQKFLLPESENIHIPLNQFPFNTF